MRSLVVCALVAVLLLPVVATAQTEVDRAEGRAASAFAELETKQREVDAWAARLDTSEARLVAALHAYEQAGALLEAAGLRVYAIRAEIEEAERRVTSLRTISEARAVAAYMNGSFDFGVLPAVDFAQSALLAETSAAAREADARALEDFTSEREDLDVIRKAYEDDQTALEELRTELDGRKRNVERLFAAVDAGLAAASRELAAADDRYRATLSELDAARRRRAAALGSSSWQPLVEKYFPPDLVDQALLVMACESRGDPDATHPESGAAGLFQFLAGTWTFASAGAGFPGASRYDAEANTAAAAWLVDYSISTGHPRGAWGHWVCQP